MEKNYKIAAKKYKESFVDLLIIGLIIAFFSYVAIILGYFTFQYTGVIVTIILVVFPLIISLKYALHSYVKFKKLSTQMIKTGFLNFRRSISLYLSMILKPMFIALISYLIIYFVTLFVALYGVSISNPEILSSFSPEEINELILNHDLYNAAIKLMFPSYIIIPAFLFFFTKTTTRDFSPYLSFEVPFLKNNQNEMNKKLLKGKRVRHFLNNLFIQLLYLIPIGIVTVLYIFVFSKMNFNLDILLLGLGGIFLILVLPIYLYKEVYNAVVYQRLAKENAHLFNDHLKNVFEQLKLHEKLLKELNIETDLNDVEFGIHDGTEENDKEEKNDKTNLDEEN